MGFCLFHFEPDGIESKSCVCVCVPLVVKIVSLVIRQSPIKEDSEERLISHILQFRVSGSLQNGGMIRSFISVFCFVLSQPGLQGRFKPVRLVCTVGYAISCQRTESRGDEGRILCRVGILRTKTAH
ncbi:hypothetical protein PILCRDRAFT_570738 [Piloderma croceum F 1598]|uniref:Uncharacterized protein n=1 Tax=Piloderma croceum (strain F 1598) TaxID=765440 RepID=A0A0C3F348_PILCF|nr:hypothetical protein PILCRDRAFT_570738 [Piloderma croceum F 1598]